ncbi:MAG TPA: PilN domain-containing protein [Buttiauxella sp.]|uniref:PilN domain-containing protein n=1 Tax=Buttiauxella sp. TaxID=1972222 RepID=UPI002B4752F4|nr:PilN domain-containing protein [Buttiauxella sp.]HKM98011.1 PilN domain-containing protein [Buttiauxella sp.]
MNVLINLLPWRQTLRQKRVRHWSVLLALVLILAPLLTTGWRLLSVWKLSQQQTQREYMANMLPALQSLYQQRLGLDELRRKRLRLQQIRDGQQQAVQIWEQRLIRLAGGLPTGAWLSSLSLQKGRIEIKGHATELEDMRRFEQELAQLDGIAEVKAGALEHESQGGFGFGFTLTLSEVVNALAN